MTQTPAQLAATIWAARQEGHTLDAEATLGTPDLATAYASQRALLALRLAAGERVVGWKGLLLNEHEGWQRNGRDRQVGGLSPRGSEVRHA